MPLVSMSRMLKAARKGRYAVGAFNIVDYASAAVVVRAAESLHAPVIVQTSVKTVKFWGGGAIVAWMRQMAGGSPIPVALHLDHCRDPDIVKACIDVGWTSVMIDASELPFEQNLAATRRVVEMARPAAVSVEAEMGRIVGVEDDLFVRDQDAHLADVEEAVTFCKGLDLAAFAPAIGTAHGLYKGEPRIAFDRIEEIARRTGVPIALHGGTGLSDEVFHKAIALGCAKVNISTALKHAFIDGFVEYHKQNRDYEPLKPLEAQRKLLEQEVVKDIHLFGSQGKAN
jgi:ketose-bisphosphate aldolase